MLQVGAAQRDGEPGADQGDRGEHDRGGGQQAPGPAGEELAEPDPAGGDGLAHQQAGDQVAGDDEEDVHSDEAAGQAGDGGVEGEDGEDGDRAQALDVGPEPRPGRRARGIGTPGDGAPGTGPPGSGAAGRRAGNGVGIRTEFRNHGRFHGW